MEWRILVQLEYRSPSKIADIHARSLIQKPQLSSAMPGLIRKGCIVRVNDPKDARAPDFAITANGLQIYRRVLKASRKRQKGLEALLTRQERLGFEAALKRLTEFYRGEMQLGRDGLFLDGADVADI
jgi:DNA-binding MarR family transcriptional regulator